MHLKQFLALFENIQLMRGAKVLPAPSSAQDSSPDIGFRTRDWLIFFLPYSYRESLAKPIKRS